MNVSTLSLTLCAAFVPVVSAFGAEHRAAAAPDAMVASAAVPAALHAAVGKPAMDVTEEAPADADSLPELPSLQTAPLRFDAGNPVAPTIPQPALRETRFSVRAAASPSGLSVLESMPLAGAAARHMGASRFNTDDGSSLDAFAICYRLNSRSSVQVIPGDPAPVKIPVTTMANNIGVTVGMVVRLSKNR